MHRPTGIQDDEVLFGKNEVADQGSVSRSRRPENAESPRINWSLERP